MTGPTVICIKKIRRSYRKIEKQTLKYSEKIDLSHFVRRSIVIKHPIFYRQCNNVKKIYTTVIRESFS